MSGEKEDYYNKIIEKIEHLRSLPQVVMRVLAMTDAQEITAVELSKALDQSLAAKVLKMANSAYYGGKNFRTVNSISHAIVIVGFDAVKEIIVTTAFLDNFHDADFKELQPVWKHSLECAMVAKRLAWVYRYEFLDEAYVTGLIHDVGKVIILQYFPDEYRQIKSAAKEDFSGLNAEKAALGGFTHAEIGGKIAEHWFFPEALVDAIEHHHDKTWTVNKTLGAILHYADLFVLGGIDFPQMIKALDQDGMPLPSAWDPNEIESLAATLQEEIEKAGNLFNFSKDL
jgi:putative nucleotidyltransferase with HDIG domain